MRRRILRNSSEEPIDCHFRHLTCDFGHEPLLARQALRIAHGLFSQLLPFSRDLESISRDLFDKFFAFREIQSTVQSGIESNDCPIRQRTTSKNVEQCLTACGMPNRPVENVEFLERRFPMPATAMQEENKNRHPPNRTEIWRNRNRTRGEPKRRAGEFFEKFHGESVCKI